MTELLNPKSSEKYGHLFCIISRGVYRPVVFFHHVPVFFFCSKSVVGRGLKLPNCGTPEKKMVHTTTGVARVTYMRNSISHRILHDFERIRSRSTRPNFYTVVLKSTTYTRQSHLINNLFTGSSSLLGRSIG